MRPHRLDDRTADRLLSGVVSPEDAPPGYEQIVGLLAAAAEPVAVGEGSAREAATVAAMQAAVLGQPVPVSGPGGRRHMLSKMLTVKAAGVAAAVVLGGGSAAAATGSLPGPAQNAAAHVLSSVGIDVPNGHGPNAHSNGHANGHANGHDTSNNSDNGSSTGPNSHALPGLCNAAKHNGTTSGHAPGKSTVFSSVATSTVCSSVPAPGQSGTAGSDQQSSGTDDQNETDSPPTSTPASGTAPVDTPDNAGTSGQPGDDHGTEGSTSTTTTHG